MKKTITILLLALVAPVMVFSQMQRKMDEEKVVQGYIIKNGEKIPGYLKIRDHFMDNGEKVKTPWMLQTKVLFVPKEVFETNKKIKRKHFDKYMPKDIDGYIYDSLTFNSVKYADLSIESNSVGSLIPKYQFLQQVVDGKISIYYHYPSPAGVKLVSEEHFEVDQNNKYKRFQSANVVYKTEQDKNAKYMAYADPEKVFSDCPHVLEKINKGEYGVVEKRSLVELGYSEDEEITDADQVEKLTAIILDYNQHCK